MRQTTAQRYAYLGTSFDDLMCTKNYFRYFKVKKPGSEKLNKKKREKKDKKVHQHHGMSTLEKKRSKALEIRKEVFPDIALNTPTHKTFFLASTLVSINRVLSECTFLRPTTFQKKC